MCSRLEWPVVVAAATSTQQYKKVRFASFFSGGFTTMAVIDPPERKLAKRTSVHCKIVLKKGL